jgi:hypothetical protein
MFVLFLVCCSASALSQDAERGYDYAREFLQRYPPPQQTPAPALLPVVDALRDDRFADAVEHCNELIARDERQFRSRPEASWIKSEAYRYRAEATFRLTGNKREEIQLLKPAADLGNLRAVKLITESIWRKFEGDPDYASLEATPSELETYLRSGTVAGPRSHRDDLCGCNVAPRLRFLLRAQRDRREATGPDPEYFRSLQDAPGLRQCCRRYKRFPFGPRDATV